MPLRSARAAAQHASPASTPATARAIGSCAGDGSSAVRARAGVGARAPAPRRPRLLATAAEVDRSLSLRVRLQRLSQLRKGVVLVENQLLREPLR